MHFVSLQRYQLKSTLTEQFFLSSASDLPNVYTAIRLLTPMPFGQLLSLVAPSLWYSSLTFVPDRHKLLYPSAKNLLPLSNANSAHALITSCCLLFSTWDLKSPSMSGRKLEPVLKQAILLNVGTEKRLHITLIVYDEGLVILIVSWFKEIRMRSGGQTSYL